MRPFRRSELPFLLALSLIAQTIPAGAVQQTPQRSVQVAKSEARVEKSAQVKQSTPQPSADWDPKDPAAVQYSDGAWGIAYNDNANPLNLIFRRSLGAGDPQYWKDPITVEPGAERAAMVTLGSTTALFYGKMVGTIREIFLKTSTNDGATWSAATQLLLMR